MWAWAVGVTTLAAAIRLAAIRISPLQLYGDEAQYWFWSRRLALGYLTKPPLAAWLIRLSTLGGDAEPFVRLPAPLLQAAAGLFLYCAGRRLYDPRAALWGLLVYTLTPAVQLGAFVISTDTPMMACLAAALWAYAALQQAPPGQGWRAAAALGLALGLGFLAKYAALYAVIGILAHLVVSPAARRSWGPRAALAACGAFLFVASPNLVWNAVNGFAAFRHLGAEAAWGDRKGGPAAGAAFVASQLGVFGPFLFAILVGGGTWLAVRRRVGAPDALLMSWAAPPLAIVLAQALIAGAKANWAVAAYAPASLLVAAWMLRWERPRILAAILGAHALVAVAGLAGVVYPRLADAAHLSSALRGVRGNRELVGIIVERAKVEQLAGPLTAVTPAERELFNLCAYYGRDYFGSGGPPLKAWLRGGPPEDEAQLISPLTPATGERVLAAAADGRDAAPLRAEFRSAGDVDIADLWTGPGGRREVRLFVGEGFEAAGAPAARGR